MIEIFFTFVIVMIIASGIKCYIRAKQFRKNIADKHGLIESFM